MKYVASWSVSQVQQIYELSDVCITKYSICSCVIEDQRVSTLLVCMIQDQRAKTFIYVYTLHVQTCTNMSKLAKIRLLAFLWSLINQTLGHLVHDNDLTTADATCRLRCTSVTVHCQCWLITDHMKAIIQVCASLYMSVQVYASRNMTAEWSLESVVVRNDDAAS